MAYSSSKQAATTNQDSSGLLTPLRCQHCSCLDPQKDERSNGQCSNKLCDFHCVSNGRVFFPCFKLLNIVRQQQVKILRIYQLRFDVNIVLVLVDTKNELARIYCPTYNATIIAFRMQVSSFPWQIICKSLNIDMNKILPETLSSLCSSFKNNFST